MKMMKINAMQPIEQNPENKIWWTWNKNMKTDAHDENYENDEHGEKAENINW